MALPLWQCAFVLFAAIAILHLYVSPYTKVEESFGIQAVHDILEYGVPVSDVNEKFRASFDHMTYPGAVPRTFIGSLVLSGLSAPEIWLESLVGKAAQTHVRAVLGGMNATALAVFARSVQRAYGPIAASWYIVLQASQFHLWYYASRTLPNMFAFFLSTISLAYLMPDPTSSLGPVKRTRLGLYHMTIATVIFRSEIALLLGAHCFWLLLKPQTLDAKLALFRTTFVPSIVPGAFLALVLTVSIDSYFWCSSSPLWPELSAFISNVFPKGGSQGASAWGTHPFYWYVVTALPRLLMNQIFMVDLFFYFPTTLGDLKVLDNLIPSYAYVLLYSILPHKETRFMFPIVPSLTLVAALTCTRFTINAHKSIITKLLLYAAVFSTIITAFASHAILLPLSAQNYPGGQALEALHDYYHENWEGYISYHNQVPSRPEVHVHLTNLALQSGVTRFLEQPTLSEPLPDEPILAGVSGTTEDAAEQREPIVLPGDANHPALTVQPKVPTPSASPLPDDRKFRNPLWVYDKSNNDTDLHMPEFWEQFDFVVVENPALAIGAWDIVREIKAVGRPRLIKRAATCEHRHRHYNGLQFSEGFWQRWISPDLNAIEQGGTTALLHSMYPYFIATPMAKLHDIVHDIVHCGHFLPFAPSPYWVDVPLETKLYILKRTTSGTRPNRRKQSLSSKEKSGKTEEQKAKEFLGIADQPSTDQVPLDFESLGPLVVNKDGTLSRLDNWGQMTAKERKRTIEYLRKRNMIRLDNVEAVAE